jgi:adenylate cyclase
LAPILVRSFGRSVDQPILLSAAFADVAEMKRGLVSVGQYALRGVSQPQELFTVDPSSRFGLTP